MLRQTVFFECDNGEDLMDAVKYAQSRTDGGRTEITLRPLTNYFFNDEIRFDNQHRVTLNMAGLGFRPHSPGFRIGPVDV
jgi:hypothetical protein